MDRKRWQQVKHVIEGALELEGKERRRYLDDACTEDTSLRIEVDSLLEGPDSGFLNLPDDRVPAQVDEQHTAGLEGRTLSHYRLLSEISRGGMGVVYRALDLNLDREVALKVLPPELVTSPERKRRFVREAKAAASLSHRTIATIYDINEDDGVTFIAMEIIHGEKLSDLFERGPLPLARALDLMVDIAEGLATAHEHGIVHRDVKPANVMVTNTGHAKIIDFGLAKLIEPLSGDTDRRTRPQTGTLPGLLMGTLSYMSPEQARGLTVDHRSDVFSFGIVLYEAITGTLPFNAPSMSELPHAIIHDEPPRLTIVDPAVAELQRILDRCLAKNPDERYASTNELYAELARTRRSVDVRQYMASPREGPAAPTLPSKQLRKVLGAFIALAALISGTALALRMFDTLNQPKAPRLTNPVQVTFADGLEDYPSWSPDGRTIAYHANNDGNFDIWIQRVGGSDALNRTRDYSGADQFPSWSPDGSQLAFWSEREGGGYFVMPTLAGPPRKLSDGVSLGAPCWSPDGRLGYIEFDGAKGWFTLVSLDTGESERFAVPADIPPGLSPACHPAGDLVAFVSVNQWESTRHALRVMRLSDGTYFTAAEDAWESWSPAWWNEETLAFVSNRGGVLDMWKLDLSGAGEPQGKPVALSMGLELRSLGFSGDGKKVAYSRGRRVANVWRVPRSLTRPATWDDVEQVTFDQTLIEFIDIKPDGSQLLFDSDRSGNPDLWIKDFATGRLSQVTAHPAADWGGRFSPDGDEVVFYSLRSGSRDVWVTSIGGPPRRLTDFPGHDLVPSWSPDGTEIAYVSTRPSYDLYKIPSVGGEPVSVRATGARTSSFDWSLDGQHLIFNLDGRLWRVHINGGSPEALTGDGVSGAMLRRAPDLDAVYMVGRGEDDNNLIQIRVGNRAKHLITDLVGRRGSMGFNGIAVDNEFAYFTWQDDLGDVWIMDVVTDASE